MVRYPGATSVAGARHIGTWTKYEIPVFHVPDMHSLNQMVGYVKHINAGLGTVVYRGQDTLHPSVIPSLARITDKVELNQKEEALKRIIDQIVIDPNCRKQFGLNKPDVEGWKVYERTIVEAILQHYEAKTFTVDFVDNHWTALWFGLYERDEKYEYHIRSEVSHKDEHEHLTWNKISLPPHPEKPGKDIVPPKQQKQFAEAECKQKDSIEHLTEKFIEREYAKEIRKWTKKCENIRNEQQLLRENDQAHLFLFLYVADTRATNHYGLYVGENTYTVDLRKSLPSFFLRPASQHGWVVKGKAKDYDFDKDIACVLRIKVETVKRMLGTGQLLSQENFFPSEKIDQGYEFLLRKQIGTCYIDKHEKKIIPAGTIPLRTSE